MQRLPCTQSDTAHCTRFQEAEPRIWSDLSRPPQIWPQFWPRSISGAKGSRLARASLDGEVVRCNVYLVCTQLTAVDN